MKIYAKGYSRSVIGRHTVADRKLAVLSFSSSQKGGAEVKLISHPLQLSGNFWLTISLTGAEIDVLAKRTTPHQLRQRIDRLQKALALMERAEKEKGPAISAQSFDLENNVS